MKKLMVSLMIALSLSACTNKKDYPTCTETKYQLIDNTVLIGDTRDEAIQKTESAFSGVAKIEKLFNNIRVIFNDPYKGNIGLIQYNLLNEKVTQVGFMYEPSYTMTLGGHVKGLLTLSEVASSKYGPQKEVKRSGRNAMDLIWATDKGMRFSIEGLPPAVILVRYQCTELDIYLNQRASTLEAAGF